MNARELISKKIEPLLTSTIGEEALKKMHEAHVRHLPIVNNTELLGLIAEDDLLDNHLHEPIGSCSLSIRKPYAKENDHVFEVLHLLAHYDLTLIPVVDNANDYLGCISQEDLINYFAKSFSFAEPGSILVIEMKEMDYSLSELARVFELEGTRILSSFITSDKEEQKIYITVKINRKEVRSILSALERYEYNVLATYTEEDFQDTLRDRYDALMAYLNV
jgi:acetoin utilization protein AcuB